MIFFGSDSSSSDFQTALIGLLGVLVGAIVGLVGVWIQTVEARKAAYRNDLRRLFAEFMETRNRWDQVKFEVQRIREPDIAHLQPPEFPTKVRWLRWAYRRRYRRSLKVHLARLEAEVGERSDAMNVHTRHTQIVRELSSRAGAFWVVAPGRLAKWASDLTSDEWGKDTRLESLFVFGVRAEVAPTRYQRKQAMKEIEAVTRRPWYKEYASSHRREGGQKADGLGN